MLYGVPENMRHTPFTLPAAEEDARGVGAILEERQLVDPAQS